MLKTLLDNNGVFSEPSKTKLGEFLVEKKLITKAALDTALLVQKLSNQRLGEILVKLGYLTEVELYSAIAELKGEYEESIENLKFDWQFFVNEARKNPNVIRLVSEDLSRSVLLTYSKGALTDSLARMYLTSDKVMSKVYVKPYSEVLRIFREKSKPYFEKEFYKTAQRYISGNAGAREFMSSLLNYAAVLNASDIHFDIEENYCRIRLRVDGILRPYLVIPVEAYKSLLGFIREEAKVAANVDLRKPLDCQFQYEYSLISIDIRVSIIPSVKSNDPNVGSCVLRLFIKGGSDYSLKALGFSSEQIKIIRRWFRSLNGLIIVTGPTGSGKSTTIRAALSEINEPDISIISVEDPVESKVNIIKQIQTQENIVTFESALKAMLRHDPDVIFVGEIRSSDVAKTAINAALTGHLVVSTLHAKDSASVVYRLQEMGLTSDVLSNSLKGIITQRLVRILCNKCKRKRPLTEEEIEYLNFYVPDHDLIETFEPVGCVNCYNLGYISREAIAEVIDVSRIGYKDLAKCVSFKELNSLLKHNSIQNIIEHGISKVKKGKIAIEEVLRNF